MASEKEACAEMYGLGVVKDDTIMKNLINLIAAASAANTHFATACGSAAAEIIKYFDFDPPYGSNEEFFHIEYQPSDGIILADNEAHVYNLDGILSRIQKNGKISSYEELGYFSI